mgnify:CR=1 FL=1
MITYNKQIIRFAFIVYEPPDPPQPLLVMLFYYYYYDSFWLRCICNVCYF